MLAFAEVFIHIVHRLASHETVSRVAHLKSLALAVNARALDLHQVRRSDESRKSDESRESLELGR